MDTKVLSNSKNIDLNGKDTCGKTLFIKACINGHKDVVRINPKLMTEFWQENSKLRLPKLSEFPLNL